MKPAAGPAAASPATPVRTFGVLELAAAIVPSLASSISVAAALWMSFAAIVSLLLASLLAALVARRMPPAAGSGIVLLAVAALVCGFDRAAAAWLPSVRAALGVSLPVAVVLMSCPVAASAFEDAQLRLRLRRASARALAAGLAFLGATGLVALAREILGAGTLTLPGIPGALVVGLPKLSEAPVRGLLSPFAGLIAAGYLAGLAVLVAGRAERRAARRGPKGGAE